MDSSTLLAELSAEELIVEAPPAIAWKLGIVDSADGVAQFMYKGGPYPVASAEPGKSEDRRPDKSYWQAVKAEMHQFLCTDDKRYKELWKRISDLDKKSTSAIVALVSAYLGSIIGVAGTVIAGFVAVCFYAVLKIGKEAYCRYSSGEA
jgi:hypothetical protein